jgi:hypothetical protein
MNIRCAVVHGVNEIFVWCCVVRCLWCGVVHGASGMNGVRCGGCGMQKWCCGVLWWLSYINCFFRFIGAALVGRVGMISSFPASPAQFNQLKHWLNVICTKMGGNPIFAEDAFLLQKKSAPKKTPRLSDFNPGKAGKILLPVEFFQLFPESDGTFQEPASRLKLALGLD